MNLLTAKLSEIKTFCRDRGIVPTADLRLKLTWIDAAQAFLSAAVEKTAELISTVTSPQAVELYKASAIVAIRFTYRAFVASCLLCIALGMSACDAWVELKALLESKNVKFSQPISVFMVATAKRRKRFQRDTLMRLGTLKLNLELHQNRAKTSIDCNITKPAQELRQRLNVVNFKPCNPN